MVLHVWAAPAHHMLFIQVKALPVEALVVVLLVGCLMLAVSGMFFSCSRMLVRSLLTWPPSCSATSRRSYRPRRSGSAVEPAGIERNSDRLELLGTIVTVRLRRLLFISISSRWVHTDAVLLYFYITKALNMFHVSYCLTFHDCLDYINVTKL